MIFLSLKCSNEVNRQWNFTRNKMGSQKPISIDISNVIRNTESPLPVGDFMRKSSVSNVAVPVIDSEDSIGYVKRITCTINGWKEKTIVYKKY